MRSPSGPRNARSRRTRAALLAAAGELLDEIGYEGVTPNAVAGRAGVTRRAVYLHFGSCDELIVALFTESSARPPSAPANTADHAPASGPLEQWVRDTAEHQLRMCALLRAVEHVRSTNVSIRARAQPLTSAQHAACHSIALRLADEGGLRPPWTVQATADLLWSLTSPRLFEALTVDRAWTADNYVRMLLTLLLPVRPPPAERC